MADRKRLGWFLAVEYDQGAVIGDIRALCGQNCLRKLFGMCREAQVTQQAFSRHAAVGAALEGPCQGAPGPNYRVQQASRGDPVTKFEPVGHQARNAKIPCQRAHHMVEPLAHEHDVLRALGRDAFAQARHALRF